MLETVYVPQPELSPSTYVIRDIDRKWVDRERELQDGDYFVRCINAKCYRIRDGRKELPLKGESRDGVYIYFDLE